MLFREHSCIMSNAIRLYICHRNVIQNSTDLIVIYLLIIRHFTLLR